VNEERGDEHGYQNEQRGQPVTETMGVAGEGGGATIAPWLDFVLKS
jgi:hypothetical protein